MWTLLLQQESGSPLKTVYLQDGGGLNDEDVVYESAAVHFAVSLQFAYHAARFSAIRMGEKLDQLIDRGLSLSS